MDSLEKSVLTNQIDLFDLWGKILEDQTPILDSIDTLKERFPDYQEPLTRIYGCICEGKGISYGMPATNSFHPALVHLVGAGESTGSLPKMLKECSQYLQKELELKENNYDSQNRNEILFYHSLNILYQAGVPLFQALSISSEYLDYPPKAVLKDMAEKMKKRDSNTPLFDLMEENETYFPAAVRQLIHVGEKQDGLYDILPKIAEQVKEIQKH